MKDQYENTVELIGTYGGDLEHALSAWTSTSRVLDEEKRARIPALLAMLAKDDHGTPFEKSAIHFLVFCDKATHIHLRTYRTGVSLNGESARYRELTDRWLYPDDFPTEEEASTDPLSEKIRTIWLRAMDTAHRDYHELIGLLTEWYAKKMLPECSNIVTRDGNIVTAPVIARRKARKRSKDTARGVLPHASQITQDLMFNFRSFMHFVKQGTLDNSPREIQRITASMLFRVAETDKFNASLEAFGWNPERILKLCQDLGVH